MSDVKLYKLQFQNKGELYTVFVKNVFQSDIFGFIGVENFVFTSADSLVIDPSEEKLRKEFETVKKSYIPMHAIVRIDEVEKQGSAKISDLPNNVTPLTNAVYTPIKNN